MSKITGNEPAFPADAQNQTTGDIFYYSGITLRQYYAGLINVSDNDYTTNQALKLMAVENSPDDPIEALKFWNSVEAKIKVMKADALINELNKTASADNTGY